MAGTPERFGGDVNAARTSEVVSDVAEARVHDELAAADRPGVPGTDDPAAGDVLPGTPAAVATGPAQAWEEPPRQRLDWLRGGRLLLVLFLGPAILVLAVLVAWPIINTIWLSVHNASGSKFIGLDNYQTMFTRSDTRRALLNNVIWVVVAPSIVTVLGLILAVLIERVSLATALKTILFMPMAISFLAAGVTFRMVYDESPDRGVANAIVVGVHDAFKPPSPYPGVNPRDTAGLTANGGGYQTSQQVSDGTPLMLPMVGLPEGKIPKKAQPAAAAATGSGVRGVVWLDFTRGGGGRPGQVDSTEKGLPGMHLEAVKDGKVVGHTTTDAQGRFNFDKLSGSGYTVRLTKQNFAAPFNGVSWLGPSLITPAIIGSYIWIWAGFAMVLISAGLAALPREALEAARVDGATEFQIFRKVTIPLVRPVLAVVLVTLVINVLKIFDLILVIAPGDSQDNANVVALEMYNVAFGGGRDYGLGSALGVLLFLFVLPAMLFRVRSMRKEAR
jgi:alpha-glucoside transport system permease protein